MLIFSIFSFLERHAMSVNLQISIYQQVSKPEAEKGRNIRERIDGKDLKQNQSLNTRK